MPDANSASPGSVFCQRGLDAVRMYRSWWAVSNLGGVRRHSLLCEFVHNQTARLNCMCAADTPTMWTLDKAEAMSWRRLASTRHGLGF